MNSQRKHPLKTVFIKDIGENFECENFIDQTTCGNLSLTNRFLRRIG